MNAQLSQAMHPQTPSKHRVNHVSMRIKIQHNSHAIGTTQVRCRANTSSCFIARVAPGAVRGLRSCVIGRCEYNRRHGAAQAPSLASKHDAKGLTLKGVASLQETELVHGACITALPTRYCGTSLLSGSVCVCAAAVPDAYAKILADHAGAIRVECVPA